MRSVRRCGLVMVCGWMMASAAWAGGPRFITGTSGYAQAGVPMAWYTNAPKYFTDPGQLAAGVTHAQADAMVAAAAAVWNLPNANLTLAQGGELAEHVNGTNSYFNGTSFVFPTDVEASNYQAIQIAVVYDTDGSIINLLLGSGASDPSGCLQNGVIESVDSFGASGTIQHALIVLNGLCVGSNSQQMLQMQYQLTRIFGRVVGLAWAQLNDNVFTAVLPVAAAQVALWPLMHPIDIICGPYTYLCMQNPFTLRMDDIAALAELYPVTVAGGGKTLSVLNTINASGTVTFPSHQGMEIVDVEVTRYLPGIERGWEVYPVVSALVGATFQQNGGNPVSGAEAANENGGINSAAAESGWSMPYAPTYAGVANLYFATNQVNQLYSGEYAVGAYQRPVPTMSGYYMGSNDLGIASGGSARMSFQESATLNWCAYPDGTEARPLALPAAAPTGMWNEALCSPGYVGWRQIAVNANTSWTIEIAAVNESGAATSGKMQPVIGVWNMSDPLGTTPTVSAQAAAGNSMVLGMTQLQMPSTASASSLRIAIAEQFGGGRPDFAYAARILYATSVAPVTLSGGGGQIVIAGTGFKLGNQVLVNGVAATVLSWTATQITATAPSMSVAGAASGTAVDVEVWDPTTGGTTDMQGALKYVVSVVDQVALVSAPAALETGYTATTPFAVRVYKPDGVTPVLGATVTFVVTGGGGGAAVVTGCQTGPGCVVKTDVTGLASTPVMGIAAGNVSVSGTELTGGGSQVIGIVDSGPARTAVINAVPQYLAAGASGSWALTLTVTQDGSAAVSVPVTWGTPGVGFTLTPPGENTTASGTAAVVVQVTGISGGPGGVGGTANVISGCAWSTVCGTWTVYGVATSQWTVAVASGAGQSVRVSGSVLVPVGFLVTDGAGDPLPGATVNFYQTVYAWEGSCGTTGACASAPVLKTAKSAATSDANGMVTVTPIEVAGVAQVVRIAAATGTKGFATVSLAVTP